MRKIQRRPVRQNDLDRTLHSLAAGFGADVTSAIGYYDERAVEPMRVLLEFYTLPWWKRLFRRPPIVKLRWYEDPKPAVEPAEPTEVGDGPQ